MLDRADVSYFGLHSNSLLPLNFQVFLAEYAGPLIAYLLFYPRPTFIYGVGAADVPRAPVVK